MPVDWTAYDTFDWAASQQSPLPPGERATLADLVAQILCLPDSTRATVWGAASPPGRFAATVVRVETGLLPPDWRERAASIPAIGVKVFKTTSDARREADRLLPFHRTQLSRLPGIPHPRVQRSLGSGQDQGRSWLVLEWLPGVGLDVWRSRFTRQAPAPLPVVRSLIEQLLGEIVLPLWSGGLIWWDFRDANCCVDPDGRLALLDVDSLAAYADEILTTLEVWTQRDRGRSTSEGRLRNMTWRLLQAARWSGKKREAAFRAAWNAHVAPTLAGIGRTVSLEQGLAGLQTFLEALSG
jgi:hypothetical protein